MKTTLYRGSVKDLLGPVSVTDPASGRTVEAVIFSYTDAFSVFDWGRMPDSIPHKGEALAILAAEWFKKLQKPETWKEFSKTPTAMALRKSNHFGGRFNEVGEHLQNDGLRTHFLTKEAKNEFTVRRVNVVKPELTTLLGRSIPDYSVTRNAPLPKLIPLEVIFRFSCPAGSSLIERLAKNPNYLEARGYTDRAVSAGTKWDFPVMELFTKLESSDRPVDFVEALGMSGLSAKNLQDVLFKTAWVAGWLKHVCAQSGVELADGKLEWALDEDGESFLVDAIGPDELRLLKDGVQLSKEFLRAFYRKSDWYSAVNQAKSVGEATSDQNWKIKVGPQPPKLPEAFRQAASEMYRALTNELTAHQHFEPVWTLEKVVKTVRELTDSPKENPR